MKLFISEIRRSINKIFIFLFLLFLLIQLGIFRYGIIKYQTTVKLEKEFQQVEKETVDCFINHEQYGTYGFSLKVTPCALYALFYNNTAFTDMIATIDTAIKLRLEETKKNQNVFNKPTGAILDLSWYILIVGSLFVMAWSFFTFRDIEYLRYLRNFIQTRGVYAGVILARVVILAGAVLSILLLIQFQFAVNGITLTLPEIKSLYIFGLVLFLVWVLLLLISATLGTFKKTVLGAIALGLAWLIGVLLWPEFFNMNFSVNSERTMEVVSKYELKKLKILKKFEIAGLKNTQRYNGIKNKLASELELAKSFLKSDLLKIEAIDREVISRTEKLAKQYFLLSLFYPVNFLKTVDNELSSCGYRNYLDKYKSNLTKRRGFINYIINKRYKANYSKPVPFIPIEKTVMAAKSHLPYYFWAGMAILFGYLALAVGLSYYCFKRSLFFSMKKGIVIDHEIDFKKGNLYEFDLYDDTFKNALMRNFLNNEKHFKKISIDGTELKTNVKELVYIPGPKKIPRNTRLDFLFDIAKIKNSSELKGKRMCDLTAYEQIEMMVESVVSRKNSTVAIFDEFEKNIPPAELPREKDFFDILKERGIVVEFRDICNAGGSILVPNFHLIVTWEKESKSYIINDVSDSRIPV